MKIYTIYLATNTVNGKQYVGYDSAWPRRMRGHLTGAYTKSPKTYKQHFHDAIRKYGKENFTWEVLYQSLDEDHTLNVMESHFIEQYRTFVGFADCNGYNLTLGGEGQKMRPVSDATRLKKSIALRGKPSQQSRPIHTPFGVFEGIGMAADCLRLHRRTIQNRIDQLSFSDWFFVDTPKSALNINPRTGRSKQIQTPYGTFESIVDCASSTGLPKSTVQTRVLSTTGFPDWFFTGTEVKKRIRQISTPFGQFDSITDASRALGIMTSTIAARLRSKKNTEWTYT
jgi:hypothetical protein